MPRSLPHFLSVDNLPNPTEYETMSVEDLRNFRRKIPPMDMTDCPGDEQIYSLHLGIICDAIDIKLNERNISLRQGRIDDAIASLSLITGQAI